MPPVQSVCFPLVNTKKLSLHELRVNCQKSTRFEWKADENRTWEVCDRESPKTSFFFFTLQVQSDRSCHFSVTFLFFTLSFLAAVNTNAGPLQSCEKLYDIHRRQDACRRTFSCRKDCFFHLQNEQIKWKLLVFPLEARPPKSGLDEFECVSKRIVQLPRLRISASLQNFLVIHCNWED